MALQGTWNLQQILKQVVCSVGGTQPSCVQSTGQDLGGLIKEVQALGEDDEVDQAVGL